MNKASSKLFNHTVIDPRDEIDARFQYCYSVLTSSCTGLSEREIHDTLNGIVCKGAQQYEVISLGLLYTILTEPSVCQKAFRDLMLLSRDGFNLVLTKINQIICEKWTKLSDLGKKQILWLTHECVRNSVIGIDSVFFYLVRQMGTGDLNPKNVWLVDTVLDLLRDCEDWLFKNAHLVPYVLYTYLRLIEDHLAPTYIALKQKEIDFCIKILRSHFTDCMVIGRDLIRLLQSVARIHEFDLLWQDILYKPQLLTPNTPNIIKRLASTRTPRKYPASRVTPELESKLAFLTHKVRFSSSYNLNSAGYPNATGVCAPLKRYQDWLARSHIARMRGTCLVDAIRFVCSVIHPPNEVLASDVTPRWSLIGWMLLSSASANIAQQDGNSAMGGGYNSYSPGASSYNSVTLCQCKMALFCDWWGYDPKRDSIMNVEPGILVIYHGLKSHPAMAQSLLEFLCTMTREVGVGWPELEEFYREGVRKCLRDILDKRVIPSLDPILKFEHLDKDLGYLIKETFGIRDTIESPLNINPTIINEETLLTATSEKIENSYFSPPTPPKSLPDSPIPLAIISERLPVLENGDLTDESSTGALSQLEFSDGEDAQKENLEKSVTSVKKKIKRGKEWSDDKQLKSDKRVVSNVNSDVDSNDIEVLEVFKKGSGRKIKHDSFVNSFRDSSEIDRLKASLNRSKRLFDRHLSALDCEIKDILKSLKMAQDRNLIFLEKENFNYSAPSRNPKFRQFVLEQCDQIKRLLDLLITNKSKPLSESTLDGCGRCLAIILRPYLRFSLKYESFCRKNPPDQHECLERGEEDIYDEEYDDEIGGKLNKKRKIVTSKGLHVVREKEQNSHFEDTIFGNEIGALPMITLVQALTSCSILTNSNTPFSHSNSDNLQILHRLFAIINRSQIKRFGYWTLYALLVLFTKRFRDDLNSKSGAGQVSTPSLGKFLRVYSGFVKATVSRDAFITTLKSDLTTCAEMDPLRFKFIVATCAHVMPSNLYGSTFSSSNKRNDIDNDFNENFDESEEDISDINSDSDTDKDTDEKKGKKDRKGSMEMQMSDESTDEEGESQSEKMNNEFALFKDILSCIDGSSLEKLTVACLARDRPSEEKFLNSSFSSNFDDKSQNDNDFCDNHKFDPTYLDFLCSTPCSLFHIKETTLLNEYIDLRLISFFLSASDDICLAHLIRCSTISKRWEVYQSRALWDCLVLHFNSPDKAKINRSFVNFILTHRLLELPLERDSGVTRRLLQLFSFPSTYNESEAIEQERSTPPSLEIIKALLKRPITMPSTHRSGRSRDGYTSHFSNRPTLITILFKMWSGKEASREKLAEALATLLNRHTDPRARLKGNSPTAVSVPYYSSKRLNQQNNPYQMESSGFSPDSIKSGNMTRRSQNSNINGYLDSGGNKDLSFSPSLESLLSTLEALRITTNLTMPSSNPNFHTLVNKLTPINKDNSDKENVPYLFRHDLLKLALQEVKAVCPDSLKSRYKQLFTLISEPQEPPYTISHSHTNDNQRRKRKSLINQQIVGDNDSSNEESKNFTSSESSHSSTGDEEENQQNYASRDAQKRYKSFKSGERTKPPDPKNVVIGIKRTVPLINSIGNYNHIITSDSASKHANLESSKRRKRSINSVNKLISDSDTTDSE